MGVGLSVPSGHPAELFDWLLRQRQQPSAAIQAHCAKVPDWLVPAGLRGLVPLRLRPAVLFLLPQQCLDQQVVETAETAPANQNGEVDEHPEEQGH